MASTKLVFITFCVLIAFAANSVLGRAALKSSDLPLIDPATYTTIRVVFGAMVLVLIQFFRSRKRITGVDEATQPVFRKRWVASVALFLYAICFSFAYIQLNAAAGTLILFAGVQFTMLIGARLSGEKLRSVDLLGSVTAFAGLVWLLIPSLAGARFPVEAGLMVLSGIAWGIYSLIGKGSADPISDTANNFLRAVPMAIISSLLLMRFMQCSLTGFVLAAGSGAITSGLGYVLWYTVLPFLTGAQAAAVQLSVPIVAGVGGVVFAGDTLTGRTVVAALIILTGIAFTIRWQKATPTGSTADAVNPAQQND